jgi:aminoglycoside phosphotransferase (APT) family kinase protein
VSDVTADALATYLGGRLDADVEVAGMEEHVEGWSRDTVSFTARWQEDGTERENRFVVRAESDAQIESDERGEGNDIETEYRTMAAASEAAVPMPTLHWYEDDRSILGGRFFVMDHVPGTAPVVWEEEERERLQQAWDDGGDLPSHFVDAAVGIHTVDPADVPALEDVPAAAVVDREIDRWVGVYREATDRPEPAVEECIRWFRANKPTVPETTLVHGDFRIGNALVDGDDLTAVLDWELARIGDPLYDLAYASLQYFAGKLLRPTERPELACSLLERDWFYEEYERRSGRTVDRERLRYWRAFAAFVMMTIGLSGVDRFRAGETDDVRSAWFQYIVPGLIEDQLAIVREDRI